MFMVHTHGMGYDKLMTKISRENKGYVPIQELQRRIALDVDSENRSLAFTEFTTKNANLFGQSKSESNRSDRQVYAASNKGSTQASAPVPAAGGATPLKESA